MTRGFPSGAMSAPPQWDNGVLETLCVRSPCLWQWPILTQLVVVMFRAMIGPTTSIAGGKPCDSRCRAAGECLFYAAQRSERMARVPYVVRDELDAEGQEIY